MTNEFEEMYNQDDFNNDDVVETSQENESGQEYQTEESSTNSTSASQEDLIAQGDEGLEYDVTKAPRTTQGPPRANLDGQEVTITDAKIILPKPESPWQLSKNGKVNFKPCQFILYYDNEGQREYYSGVKVFERKKDGVSKYSEPVIQNNGETQVSKLKSAYAKYRGVKPEEISLHEFLSFLKAKPKARIEQQEFKYDDNVANKNIVVEFK